MRYREILRKNGPLTLFAMSGVGVLRAMHRAEQAGPKWARPRHGRTYVVEINRGADELPGDPALWPAPLSELAEDADVRIAPTPGRNTTCLRITDQSGSGMADLGRRVRETKQLLETGEVLVSPAVLSGQAAPSESPAREFAASDSRTASEHGTAGERR